MVLPMLLLGACKQNEFFQKTQLSEISPMVPTNPNAATDSGVVATNENSNTNGGFGANNPTVGTGSGNSTGTNAGTTVGIPPTTTTPIPVVVTPSVTTPPTPVVVAPPVITPPTPVVVAPPVTTPPTPVVVAPPVITPPTPVVVAPPVITPPVATITLSNRSENFVQNKNRDGDVDILWVIDDSGSMADNQAALAQNFQIFIDQFLTKNINFKMAITTTDGTTSRNGKMVGDTNLLTQTAALNNKSEFLSNFSRWVKVGTYGSGTEQGLKCASSFFDRYGTSFLRKDAFLAIVFLSDEEDQSEKKVPEYLAKFLSLKENKGMVKAYSIVTQKIPKHASWESIGTRYNSISQSTNGSSSDITSNFGTTLQDMGGTIVNLVDQFALSETPYGNSLEVFVNNVKQLQGWTYNPTSKSVKFLANSIPAEGSNINIKYSVALNLLGSN